MELNVSSQYTQINDFLLLEYEYNSAVINTSQADFIRVLNSFSGTMSYMNYNPSNYSLPKTLTGNVLDYSVQQISDNTFVHFDIDRPIKFYEQNKALFFQPLYIGRKTELNVVYDSIKIHVVSGYNFDNLSGLIIRASYVDVNTFAQVFVANVAYLKEDSHINFNPHPMLLGDRVYDRYIEVKIPSLKSIIDTESQVSDLFGADIEYDQGDDTSVSYINELMTTMPKYEDARINLIFYDIYDYGNGLNGQLEIKTALPLNNNTQGIVRRELMATDSFSNLSAIIQESVMGDYFEIFPTYNGEFIEDFVYERSRLGDDYMAIHDIEVYEQISNFGDYDEVMTHKQTFFQEDGFDKAFKFRPIIESVNAVTFTIEYTFRLLNKVDNSQIIRRSTFTYPDAKKYALWMTKLNIPMEYQPMRIVNKIIRNSSGNFDSNFYNIQRTENSKNTSTQGSLIPIQFKDISINSFTLFVDSTDTVTPTVLYEQGQTPPDKNNFNFKDFINSDVIYGQGDGKLYINKFDNFIKFKIYKYSDKTSGIPQVYSELKSSININFYLIFTDETGEEIRIKELKKVEHLNIDVEEDGVLIFKIPGQSSSRILNSTNKEFLITIENNISTNVTGTDAWNTKRDFETVLYSGTWETVESFSQIDSIEYVSKSKLLEQHIDTMKLQEHKIDLLQKDYDDFMRDMTNTKLDQEQETIVDEFKDAWSKIIDNAKKL